MNRFRLPAALILCVLAGCGEKASKKRTGPLNEWIVGAWVRSDDPIAWIFKPDGEMTTEGRLPIEGGYGTEEPDKVTVRIGGAGALTAGMMLGLHVEKDQGLTLEFVVKDDEMRPVGINSSVVFKKR